MRRAIRVLLSIALALAFAFVAFVGAAEILQARREAAGVEAPATGERVARRRRRNLRAAVRRCGRARRRDRPRNGGVERLLGAGGERDRQSRLPRRRRGPAAVRLFLAAGGRRLQPRRAGGAAGGDARQPQARQAHCARAFLRRRRGGRIGDAPSRAARRPRAASTALWRSRRTTARRRRTPRGSRRRWLRQRFPRRSSTPCW